MSEEQYPSILPELTPAAKRILLIARAETIRDARQYIDSADILIGVLAGFESPAANFLKQHGVTLTTLRDAMRDATRLRNDTHPEAPTLPEA